LPELVASIVFDVAAVRILFPFYFGDLMVFHPGHSSTSQEDSLDLTLQHAGRELGVVAAVEALLAEVERSAGIAVFHSRS
jgi:hypothetical protein